MGIRPEDVLLLPDAGPLGANQASGTVTDVRFLGEGLAYDFRAGATMLKVKAHRSQIRAQGEPMRIALPADYCMLVRPAADGAAAEEASLGLDDRAGLARAAQ
jgi:ABC-type sugar transport system ATPase subunit